jgi:hypothetical protein
MKKTIHGNATYLQDTLPKHSVEVDSYHAYYSSPEHFATTVEGWDKKKAWDQDAWEGSEEFYGCKDMPTAIQLARYGWREGVTQIHKIQRLIAAAFPTKKEPVKYGVAGVVPNIPRAIAGNPLNMKQMASAKSRSRPVITLISDMGANCGHSTQEFINRAAVVTALIDKIEDAGYACELIGTATTQSHRDKFNSQVSVLLKHSHQPLDLQRLSFGLGHPAMFRRLIFAQWTITEENKRLGHGLGGHLSMDKKNLAEKNIYIIPSVNGHRHFSNEEKTIKEGLPFLINSLKEQGCPAFKVDKT